MTTPERRTPLLAALAMGAALSAAAQTQAPSLPVPARSTASDAPKTETSAEKALRGRVTEYWAARRAANLHAAYPFYEAAFRAKYTADQFARDFRRLNRFAPELLGIESVAVDASGNKAVVKVKLRAKVDVLDGRELDSVIAEDWLLEEGTWMLAAEPLLPNI